MEVKQANGNSEVEKIIDLRDKILRQPWGQPKETATDAFENSSINAYIVDESGNVIACGRLQENENKIGQIRFMAVEKVSEKKLLIF